MKNFLLLLLLIPLYRGFAINSFDGMLQGSESPITVISNGELQCLHYAKYTIITHPQEASSGQQVIIRKGSYAKCNWNKKNGWYVNVPKASYFIGIYNDILLFDNGTGPSLRKIYIYNIKRKNLLTKFDYFASNSPININESGTLEFWRNSKIIATESNCPLFQEAKNKSLMPVIVKYNQANLNKRKIKLTTNNTLKCLLRN